ncbi:MAG: DUF58 domain-containing protein [Bacteroidota bacterium]
MSDIKHQDVKHIENYELLAKQLVEGFITGLHRSPYHGFSVEFAEHKQYNVGESTRHIDWKAYAKTDRLYVKRYEEETNLRCTILIDNSSSMRYPSAEKGKIRFALQAASGLIYLLQRQRDAVGLVSFSEGIDMETAVKSTGSHAHSLFNQLNTIYNEQVEERNTNIPEVLHKLAKSIHKRSLVVVLSDLINSSSDLDDVFKALQHLKHKKHEILLFHIKDAETEDDFEFSDLPHVFVDLETKEKIHLNPGELKEEYKKQREEFKKKIYMKCHQNRIDLIEADINEGVNEILRAYLIKRKRML